VLGTLANAREHRTMISACWPSSVTQMLISPNAKFRDSFAYDFLKRAD